MDTEARIAELEHYYELRAPEYEALYYRRDPVRRAELAAAGTKMNGVLGGCRVLEVACGTGYWTRIVSPVAQEIVAIDVSSEMLALAAQKEYPSGNVRFCRADAYRLDTVPGSFDAGLVNFWISHVPRVKLNGFLRTLHEKVGEGAHVFMMDNLNTPGCGGEFVHQPGCEDTFKIRELSDGSRHRIIKNYFDGGDLQLLLGPHSVDLDIEMGQYYWWLSYLVRLR